MANEKNLSVMILLTTEKYALEALHEFNNLVYRDFIVAGVIVIDRDMRGEKICTKCLSLTTNVQSGSVSVI